MYKNIIILLLAGLLGYKYFIQNEDKISNIPVIPKVNTSNSIHACFFDNNKQKMVDINY